jgi:hypothetical protein
MAPGEMTKMKLENTAGRAAWQMSATHGGLGGASAGTADIQ